MNTDINIRHWKCKIGAVMAVDKR